MWWSQNGSLMDRHFTWTWVADLVKYAPALYLRDLIDAIRQIKEKGSIQQGIQFLIRSVAQKVSYISEKYNSKGERSVPEFELELIKKSEKPTEFFAKLNYKKSGEKITFAQFDIDNKFSERIKNVVYPEI